MDKLNWAVLGTGVVANQMAQAMQGVGCKLYAVGNRTHSKAVDFADKYGIEKVYDDLNDMFYDDNVDVIYITSPHNTHIDFIMKALENGKHILCEKSITLNSVELEKALKKADGKNLVLAEAMTIYHMPLYKKLMKLVADGEIGDVSMIQANFGSYKDYDMKNRFFNMNLAGGAMLDIGVYAISLARCFLKSKPDNVISTVKFAPSGVDEMSGIVMTNKEGQMTVISLSLHTKQPKRCVICGDKGYIEIMEYPRACKATIVCTETGERKEICEGETERALQYEMEDMEEEISKRSGCMLREYTKDVMEIMTDIRNEWGLKYPPFHTATLFRFHPHRFHCRFTQNNRKDVLYAVIRDISRLWNIRERVRRRLSAPKQASEKKSVRVKPKERCSMKWRIWRRRFQSEAVVCLGSIQKTLWKL